MKYAGAMTYNRIVAFALSIPITIAFGDWMDSYVAGCFMFELLIFINILFCSGMDWKNDWNRKILVYFIYCFKYII